EASRVVGRYLETLRDREPEAGELRAVVADALRDPTAEVAFWLADQHVYVNDAGEPVVLPQEGRGRAMTRIDRQGEHLGVILHRASVTTEDLPALDATLRVAAVAFDHGRLRAQVMVQLAEVRASRARIVE